MMKVIVEHRRPGTTEVVKRPCVVDKWHKTHIDGSFGRQPMWYLFTYDEKRRRFFRATVYEDRSPCTKNRLRPNLRRYRWDVYPNPGGYSFARGDAISLNGAKIMAETCADLASSTKPFDEKLHGR